MQLSIVIPFLNEQESLPELTDWIVRVVTANNFSYEIIYVDDGSSDGSWNYVEQICNTNPNVKGIKFRRNYGKSAALNEGFQLTKGDVVFTMDADLQDSPDEIPVMYQLVAKDGYDIVSGWKRKRHDPISKTIPSKLFNRVTRMMSGIKIHDFNCGLKAYNSDVIKSIEIQGEMHRYIPVIAKRAGFKKITEKIVEHRKRKYGKSKFGWERFVNGFLDLLTIQFVSRFGKRPMHLFGTLGLLSFFIGFVISAYLAYGKIFLQEYKMTERPIFYLGILAMIIGVQLFVAGFLAELISRNSANKDVYLVEKKLNV